LSNPIISVITPTHNSELTIKRCIHSIVSQSYDREKFEVIVVDDGSKDRTVEYAKEAADFVITTEKCTVGKARNIGAKKARGKFFAFIDADCQAKDGWLKTIVNELETTDAITGPIENGLKNNLIAWAEYLIEFSEYNEYKCKTPIRFLAGCNQACRSESFKLVGGFADIPVAEDISFGVSLKKAGIDCYFIPEMQIRHLGVSKISQLSSKFKKRGALRVKESNLGSARYELLSKGRRNIPIFFFGRIISRCRYAIKAKKLGIFLISFPFIVVGIASFCRGAWNGFQNNN